MHFTIYKINLYTQEYFYKGYYYTPSVKVHLF